MNNNEKDINLIAIKSLIECIDNRDIAEGGIFLDDDNAEFVADILRYHYKSLTTENKMAEVAKLFGKKLGEEFTVEHDHDRFDCEFGLCGFIARGAYENPYMAFDCFILEDLLTGEAVIVDEDR